MKILIDINHPAHVHYFRNFIKIMGNKGHKILIISRNKEIEHYLLNYYNIPFINRGKGSNSKIGKIFYFFSTIYFIFNKIIGYKPYIIISFGTPYAAISGWLLRIPHISFNDTEHAKMHHILTDPFSKYIITPNCYTKDLGKKHIRFNGYMELNYLHQKYFNPDNSVLKLLKIKDNEKYVILRFVSWNAIHDVGHSGLTLEMKRKLVIELSKYAKVFISSEGELPADLKKYKIKIPPEKIHSALFFASLFVGEGATMASECAMLGISTIYVNSLSAGSLKEQEKYGLIFSYKNSDGVLEKAIELLKILNVKQVWKKRREKMLSDKIDVTAFMVWFVENYPKSVKIMKENPSFQDQFK